MARFLLRRKDWYNQRKGTAWQTSQENSLTMANFMMAFMSEALMFIMYESQSDEWPTHETQSVVSN